jgi:hypothetical protein
MMMTIQHHLAATATMENNSVQVRFQSPLGLPDVPVLETPLLKRLLISSPILSLYSAARSTKN